MLRNVLGANLRFLQLQQQNQLILLVIVGVKCNFVIVCIPIIFSCVSN